MEKERGFILILMLCFVGFSWWSIYLIYSQGNIFNDSITGMSSANGGVQLFIESPGDIFIHSPENITYNFSQGSIYWIDLNVSSNFIADKWKYTLYDLRHGEVVYENMSFVPNETISAVRWSNELTVYANDSNGQWHNASVIFFVYVNGSAPILGEINDTIYVCEADRLNYYFNATDLDEDDLTFDVSPKDPFYTQYVGRINLTTEQARIYSGDLEKEDVGNYSENISVSDSIYVDTKNVNITVIEINNPPVMVNIGVQTVWIIGEGSTFSEQVVVNDVEDGNQDSGNLIFNISFPNDENLFNITSSGMMEFTPNESQIGIYDIQVCVEDTGIDSPSANISLCGQDGGPISVCQNFNLTVTNINRAPTITEWYPEEFSLYTAGTDSLYFNITKYDPDWTIPDAYWFVDGVLKEYDSGSLFDEFNYLFGCGVSGNHVIKAEVTDGALNDSVEWNVSVGNIPCSVGLPSSGGGGGGGGLACFPEWVCGDWYVCQNTERGLNIGLLSGEDYRLIKDSCLENWWEGDTCGFQIKDCLDLNSCGTDVDRPIEFQACHYVKNPSCSDGVKNCHDGGCELLVDCGGPCIPCPTCSDKIKNQGEGGVDCGGPCPWLCPVKKPIVKPDYFAIVLLVLLIILLIFVIVVLVKIINYKKKIMKYRLQEKKKWG
ncbi:hypothetical protein KAI32_02265 [Candidatus Pacearchaeota archaeon]|nr:hypothetical protein [Candidatus Pacearchaeota archaeon]